MGMKREIVLSYDNVCEYQEVTVPRPPEQQLLRVPLTAREYSNVRGAHNLLQTNPDVSIYFVSALKKWTCIVQGPKEKVRETRETISRMFGVSSLEKLADDCGDENGLPSFASYPSSSTSSAKTCEEATIKLFGRQRLFHEVKQKLAHLFQLPRLRSIARSFYRAVTDQATPVKPSIYLPSSLTEQIEQLNSFVFIGSDMGEGTKFFHVLLGDWSATSESDLEKAFDYIFKNRTCYIEEYERCLKQLPKGKLLGKRSLQQRLMRSQFNCFVAEHMDSTKPIEVPPLTMILNETQLRLKFLMNIPRARAYAENIYAQLEYIETELSQQKKRKSSPVRADRRKCTVLLNSLLIVGLRLESFVPHINTIMNNWYGGDDIQLRKAFLTIFTPNREAVGFELIHKLPETQIRPDERLQKLVDGLEVKGKYLDFVYGEY